MSDELNNNRASPSGRAVVNGAGLLLGPARP